MLINPFFTRRDLLFANAANALVILEQLEPLGSCQVFARRGSNVSAHGRAQSLFRKRDHVCRNVALAL